MPPDLVIQNIAAAQTTKDYTLPDAMELVLKCVTASFDGTSAASTYTGEVQVIDNSGLVIARCPCSTNIAAGASADISWFRLKHGTSTSSTTSAYQQQILTTPNLFSYWTLDETSGTTFADSGSSNAPMTITGVLSLGTPPLIQTGHSAGFPGTVDGLGNALQYARTAAGYGLAPGGGSQTVEAWIRTTDNGSTLPQILCMDDNQFRYMQFRMNNLGQLEYITFANNNSTATTLDSSVTINDGAAHYVAGTFDASGLTMTVYVDGTARGTAHPGSANTGNTPKATLGARTVGSAVETPWNGTIDEVAIYSRALSASEILAHYNLGVSG